MPVPTADDQFVYVTTTGRKTGLTRQIEIWFVDVDGLIYILAEHGYKAQWVKNILSDPRVRIAVAIGNGWQRRGYSILRRTRIDT